MIELSSDDIKTLVTAREILNHLATDPATGGGLALGVSSGLTILLRNVVVAEKQSVLAQGDPPESPKLTPADAKAWAGESSRHMQLDEADRLDPGYTGLDRSTDSYYGMGENR